MSRISKLALGLILGLMLCASQARAGIIGASVTGDATTTSTPDAQSNPSEIEYYFTGLPVSTAGLYPASAFLTTITGLNGATFSFTTDTNYDYTISDRLVLDITNNSGSALNSITFGAPLFFYENEYPVAVGMYTPSSQYPPYGAMGVSYFPAPNANGFTYDFTNPLAVGASVAFYLPVVPGAPGATFTVTESVTAAGVPEPSTFVLLGLGAIGLAIGAYRRRPVGKPGASETD